MALEHKLGRGHVVRITPKGVDDTNFDYEFYRNIGQRIFDGSAQLGIVIVDEHNKKSDVFGQYRRFKVRAHQRDPVDVPVYLRNEATIDNDHVHFTKTFLKKLVTLEPPQLTFTRKEAEGESVYGPWERYVKRTIEHKKWWTQMFVDLYTRSSGMHSMLGFMNKETTKVMRDRQKFKRYVFSDLLIDLLVDDKRDPSKATGRDFSHCLQRHGSFKQPFMFRKEEDYTYFLLGFHHRGLGLDRAHSYMTEAFHLQSELSSAVTGYQRIVEMTLARHPDAALAQGSQPQQWGLLFGPEFEQPMMQRAYDKVTKFGHRRFSPALLTEEQKELGFYVRQRNNPLPRGMRSYALTKIRRNERHIQREAEYAIALKRGVVQAVHT